MAENMEDHGCPQRDSAEHEGYAEAHRSFNRIWKERCYCSPKLSLHCQCSMTTAC